MKLFNTVLRQFCLIRLCWDFTLIYLMKCPKRGLLRLFERDILEMVRMSAHKLHMWERERERKAAFTCVEASRLESHEMRPWELQVTTAKWTPSPRMAILTFIGCKSLETWILAFASSVPDDDIVTGTLTETVARTYGRHVSDFKCLFCWFSHHYLKNAMFLVVTVFTYLLHGAESFLRS
jgi:hypothetical protein